MQIFDAIPLLSKMRFSRFLFKPENDSDTIFNRSYSYLKLYAKGVLLFIFLFLNTITAQNINVFCEQKKSYCYKYIDKCRQMIMFKHFYCNSKCKIETIRKRGKNINTQKQLF